MALLFMMLVHLTLSTRSNCESDTCVEESSPTDSVLKRQDIQQNIIAETSMSIKKWMDENDIKLTNDAWGKLTDHGFLSIDDLTSLPVNQAMNSFETKLKIKTADLWKLQKALSTLANKKNFIDPDELVIFQSMQVTLNKLQNEVHGLKLKQTKLAEHKTKTLRSIDEEFEKMIASLNQRKTVLTQQLADVAMRKNAEIETEIFKANGVIGDVRKMHDATNALLNTAISLDELNDRKTKIVQYQIEMNEKLKTKQENAVQINEKIGCVFDTTASHLQSINETGSIYDVGTPLLSDVEHENGSVNVAWRMKDDTDLSTTKKAHIEYIRRQGGDDDDAKWTETVFDCNDKKQEHVIEIHEAGVYIFRVKLYLTNLQTFTPYSNVKSIQIDAVDMLLSASVILDQQEKNILLQWMRGNVLQNDKSKQLKLSLLYRMSRDGRDLGVVHSKCYGEGPTLAIIQSRDYNHVCGGYTSRDWKASGGASKDENAFIFLLRSQFGHQPKIFKPKDVNQAVHYASFGPSWGTGCTLRIAPRPGYDAYSFPDAIYGVTGNELLGGSTYEKIRQMYSYWLKDYEVFKVTAS